MSVVKVEVKGLKQAQENLKALSEEVGTRIVRASLRAASWEVASAVRAATYRTFVRRTGQIKRGFGVRVGEEPKDEVFSAVVVQYPTGTSGPLLAAARKKMASRSVAFWWRFLEFGTSGRKTARTPKHLRLGRIARTRKQQVAEAKYSASRSLGDLSARPWVRPAFKSSAGAALEKFTNVVRKETEAEVSKLPK